MAVAVVAALGAGAFVVHDVVRGPLPQVSGTIAVPGLSADVRVLRDERGVPQIFADTAEDLFRAQGFVHAQDRFFEMDMRRHITAGRMAELVGNVPAAIEADKVIRTFGWRRVAEQEWDLMSEQNQAWLTAYAEGVNAFLDGRAPRDLALEYSVLGLQVPVADREPWTPVDSLAWFKALAWDLRSNYDAELQRSLAYAELGDLALVERLFPPSAGSGAVPIVNPGDPAGAAVVEAGAVRAAAAGEETHMAAATQTSLERTVISDGIAAALAAAYAAVDAVPVLMGRGEAVGSNSWVVSGEHTISGRPMLANDPHLGLEAPSIFTQVGLHCTVVGPECPFDVAGFGFAGFPGVIIGHNGHLAWGITNMGPDVTDFFVEELDGDTHLRDGQWLPLDVRTEVIEVAGGDPIELTVRMVGDRPIISDVLPVAGAAHPRTGEAADEGSRYAVSLAWTALIPGHSAETIFAINQARDADDVATAAALFEVPAQAIVFATADGDIGFQAPGRIPVRAVVDGSPVPTDGTWPRDGRDSAFDWQGFIPFEDLPRMLNPEEGFIVAANQAVLPLGGEPFMGMDFDHGMRSERIRTLLTEHLATGVPFGVGDFHRILTDVFDPTTEVLLPALLSLEASGADAAALDLLRGWDGMMHADSAAAAYFGAVWRDVMNLTFRDDLPEAAWPNSRSRWVVVVRDLLGAPTDVFWDDAATPGVETRDDVLAAAVTSAREYLTERFSPVPADWRWGDLHRLALQHPVLGGEGIPGFVRSFVNPDPVPLSGSTVSVVASGWDPRTDDALAARTGQAMRLIVDTGAIDASTWVIPTGVSGHPASPHYADQLEAWATGGSFPMRFTRDAVEQAARHELRLTPAG